MRPTAVSNALQATKALQQRPPDMASMLFQRASRRRSSSLQRFLIVHLGAAGLFALAILDNSPLPTFGGLDLLTAILAARHLHAWYYYAAVSTAGSLVGAYLTFRLGRRGGASYINRKFGEARAKKVLDRLSRWGWKALIVSCVVPFPFPTSMFFLGAGILDYALGRFLITVAICRAVRYSALAYLGASYGRHFTRVLNHPTRYVTAPMLFAVVIVVLTAALIFLWNRKGAHRDFTQIPGHHASASAAGGKVAGSKSAS